MLTNRARYGIRAMCALAGARGESLQAKAIAASADVPLKFLEAILVDLRRAGFVNSARGKAGGHALARPAESIVVGDVIRAIDGPLAPVRCASVTAYKACPECPDPDACALRAVTSTDGMTADFYHFDMEFLGRVANRIVQITRSQKVRVDGR